MRHRLRDIIAATGSGAALLLAVAFVGLWVFSYFRFSSYGYYAQKDQQGWYWRYRLSSYRGSISYTWARQGSTAPGPLPRFQYNLSSWDEPNRYPWLWAHRDDLVALAGFHYEHRGVMSGPLGTGMGWRTIAVPYWFLIALAMIMPIAWFRRSGNIQAGLCGVCGYDLRATPHAGGVLLARCPECGAQADP